MKYILLAISLMAASASAFAAEEYYTWQDEQGLTHYSKIPPEGYKSKRITVNTPQPSVIPTPATEDEKAATDVDKVAEYCQQIKDNLAVLNKYKTAKTQDPDGKERTLTPEEMLARKEEMLTLQKTHC